MLAPRPWTVAQSRWAADLLERAPAGPVLELCSGAGHIGLLAAHLSGRALVCVDSSPAACSLARLNAERAGVRVEVREGLMDAVLDEDEQFAAVIADPPWVPRDQVAEFPEDPVTAIDGGRDGLDLVRTCLEVVAGHLAPGGTALLQVGPSQVPEVRALVATRGEALAVGEVRELERGALVRLDRAFG